LQHQQEAARQRIKMKQRQEVPVAQASQAEVNLDDLGPADSISNQADPEQQPAETDDDKIRRLSTAERQEQEDQEQPSSSLEIPGSYDDSSGVTEHPEPDILIIDHQDNGDQSDQPLETSDHRNKAGGSQQKHSSR